MASNKAWRVTVVVLATLILGTLLTACGPTHKGETAAAAPSAQAASPTPATTVVEFWTTDQQPDRLNAYNAVAQRFMGSHHNIDLRIVPKDESTVTADLMAAAQAK